MTVVRLLWLNSYKLEGIKRHAEEGSVEFADIESDSTVAALEQLEQLCKDSKVQESARYSNPEFNRSQPTELEQCTEVEKALIELVNILKERGRIRGAIPPIDEIIEPAEEREIAEETSDDCEADTLFEVLDEELQSDSEGDIEEVAIQGHASELVMYAVSHCLLKSMKHRFLRKTRVTKL